MRVETPAKINLFLKILGRRADGFHDLQTIMVSIGLHDSLQFRCAPAGQLELRSIPCGNREQSIPSDERNLILKAARLLQQETSTGFGAEITLWKRIPAEAGLGGGSSNAAAALVALNTLWNLKLTSQQLHELASRLGSDVNFFLDSTIAAVCTGRGEQIQPVALRRGLHVVVIKPPVGLSTAKVFQRRSEQHGNTNVDLDDVLRSMAGCAAIPQYKIANDLQQPARELSPEVDQLLCRLRRQEVLASGMTGSGSSCFALCRTARQARTLAARARSWGTGKVFVTTTEI